MNWSNRTTWRGLMAILGVLGVAWIALSRVPTEMSLTAGRFRRPRFRAADTGR